MNGWMNEWMNGWTPARSFRLSICHPDRRPAAINQICEIYTWVYFFFCFQFLLLLSCCSSAEVHKMNKQNFPTANQLLLKAKRLGRKHEFVFVCMCSGWLWVEVWVNVKLKAIKVCCYNLLHYKLMLSATASAAATASHLPWHSLQSKCCFNICTRVGVCVCDRVQWK